MTGTCSSTPAATAPGDSEIDANEAAQARLSAAYTAARRGVFDVLPRGAIQKDLLTCAQRRMLVELEAAEHHLDQMRRAAHRCADVVAVDVERAG